MKPIRAPILFSVLVLLGAACSTDDDAGAREEKTSREPRRTMSEPATPEERLDKIRRVTSGACTPGHNAAAYFGGTGLFCLPFDAIPAVDHPRFTSVAGADIPPNEPVAIISVRGVHKAYPIRYLSTHEIVNDRISGRTVAVTFCPLCNSAVTFDRRVGGRDLVFGVSGQLLSGNLVMFDRQTISMWQQVSGKAFGGEYRGTVLDQLPTQLVSFSAWAEAHPDGKVMTRPAEGRDYSVDPYAGYALDPNQESKFFSPPPESGIKTRTDPRLPPKRRVVGVKLAEGAVAFAEPKHSKRHAIAQAKVGGRSLVAFFVRDTASTSMNRRLADSPLGWAGSVWFAEREGAELSFDVHGSGFLERTTGSTFDRFGRALEGPLKGMKLRKADQITAFWFSWVDTHPRTEVVTAR